MDIRLFQINKQRDENSILFEPLDRVPGQTIDSSIYDLTYAGNFPKAESLEDIFQIFNVSQPPDFMGRSMSVSDVVEVRRDGGSDFYYCDSIGFKKISFDSQAAAQKYNEKIDVVFLEPGKKARIGKIDAKLEAMQAYVGGYIEAVYPFDEPVALICNDEGKLQGLELNRALVDDDGNVYDAIAGKAFVCGCKGENFTALDQNQLEAFSKRFENPELFVRTNNGITVVPIVEPPAHKQKR